MHIKHLWWKIAAMKDPHHAIATIDSAIKPYCYPFVQKLNKGIFAIEMNNPKMGFFAKLTWCLFILYYCQRRELIPYIELTSPNYLNPERGRDWFKYYFINSIMLDQGYDASYRPRHITRIRSISDLKLPGWCYHDLPIEHAANLFKSAIGIRPEITSTVDAYARNHFSDRKILGIHFRGTDKTVEAPRVTWDYCERTIRNYLEDHSDIAALFVASDEARFIEHISAKFQEMEVLSHEDHYRSEGGRAIHSLDSGGDNYLKGKDALVNSLLLSKCSAVIRSSSFLSAWSSVFNAALPVILLNKPRTNALWFPEVEIMKKSLDHYLPQNI